MTWFDGECDEHGPLEDGQCPRCPTKEELIAARDFYGLACRVLEEHWEGGWATKASYLGRAMEMCFEAGKETGK
jgi:hypothetical protein